MNRHIVIDARKLEGIAKDGWGDALGNQGRVERRRLAAQLFFTFAAVYPPVTSAPTAKKDSTSKHRENVWEQMHYDL
jgi:hypothetical protein